MIRFMTRFMLCICFAISAACSKREQPQPDETEWSDIQPMADDADVVPVPRPEAEAAEMNEVAEAPRRGTDAAEDFSELIQRLNLMQTSKRQKGETLITSDSLVFDHDRRYVRMDGNVVVQDEYGEVEAQSLTGHFSASNEVEYIELSKGMVIRSKGREASAQNATYHNATGEVLLSGKAQAFEGGNRLAGERMQFWMKGDRKMVCEPNALLVISEGSSLSMGGEMIDKEMTEIRSDRMVYNENEALVRFNGHVRVRDPRMAMDCKNLRLNLKENNEIDWIVAESEVIIQSDGRKALSDKAYYYADDGKFVLEGEPKVMQNRNIMTGESIVFWHNSRRLVCEPNARILLYPDETMRAKFLQDLKD